MTLFIWCTIDMYIWKLVKLCNRVKEK